MPKCKSLRRLCMTALLLLSAACTDDVALKGKVPRSDPSSAWKRVVEQAGTNQGIDFDHIEKKRKKLEQYLLWASVHGQHADSWRESREDKRVAFLLNVYNAAVIHNVLRHQPLRSPDEVQVGLYRWPGAGFYRGTRYKVDEEFSTLRHIAVHDTIHRYQEPLLWVALHDGTQDSAPLQWWTGKKLQSALKKAMKKFLTTDRGLTKTSSGWAANPRFVDQGSDFTFWSDASTVCAWMVDYTSGPRKAWMQAHAEDCPLERRTPNRALDALVDPQR